MGMQKLLAELEAQYPKLRFEPGEQFCWSPETGEILYKAGASGNRAKWSLLHETGHALLGHTNYQADFELIRLEMAAWHRAKELAADFKMVISEDHIQDCLDTYRDWLHKRSICPSCNNQSLQQADFIHYRCFNCHTTWSVSGNRFGRSYRSTKTTPQTSAILLKTLHKD
jgi:hypothetical protein